MLLTNILVLVIKHLLLLPLLLIPALLKVQTDSVTNKISKIPYKHVDVLAKFPQGDFKNYISNNLQNNHKSEYSIKGQIILLMTIGSDGAISQVLVLKSLSPKIDPEVVRVINASPKWEPATLNNQKVSMDMVLNIDIAISGIKKPVEQAKITNTAVANISRPIYRMVKPPVAKSTLPPVKKAPVVTKNISRPPAKNIIIPVVKKSPPVIIKVIPPTIVKKPAPTVAKKVILPTIKKTKIIAKTIPAPVVKKPTPVIAVKAAPPVIKKPAALIVKKVEKPFIKKPALPTVKAAAVAKHTIPPTKRKRIVIKQDLFSPNANTASFIGGDKGLAQYLGSNIAYPEKAKKTGIEGRVVLSFVVEEDGSVDDVEVISSPSEDLSQEAIRVMLASPKWKPGQQNGIHVAMSFIIPIKFSLSDKATN